MTTRRNFYLWLSTAVLAAPSAFAAEPPSKIWRVGFLALGHIDYVESSNYYGGFRQGMGERGYVEGRNMNVIWRSAEGRADLLPNLANELVKLNVDIIVTACTASGRAAMNATTNIPIVLGETGHPVLTGLVKSLAEPGGNVTGIYSLAGDLLIKKLELLQKMVPGLSRVGILVNPDSFATEITLAKLQSDLRGLGIALVIGRVRTAQDIEQAFAYAKQQDVGAMIVSAEPFLQQQQKQVVQLLSAYKLPSASGYSEFVDNGGLASYGTSLAPFRRAAVYVDKIFKGTRPASLPMEIPTTLDIVVNEKTAKELGLTIPRSVLISATRVVR